MGRLRARLRPLGGGEHAPGAGRQLARGTETLFWEGLSWRPTGRSGFRERTCMLEVVSRRLETVWGGVRRATPDLVPRWEKLELVDGTGFSESEGLG